MFVWRTFFCKGVSLLYEHPFCLLNTPPACRYLHKPNINSHWNQPSEEMYRSTVAFPLFIDNLSYFDLSFVAFLARFIFSGSSYLKNERRKRRRRIDDSFRERLMQLLLSFWIEIHNNKKRRRGSRKSRTKRKTDDHRSSSSIKVKLKIMSHEKEEAEKSWRFYSSFQRYRFVSCLSRDPIQKLWKK